MSDKATEFHIDITGDQNHPVDLLSQESGLSRQKVKQAMQKGAVWITDKKGTHRLRRQNKILADLSILHFYYDKDILEQQVDDAILIADEGDYSTWYKPRGMLSQGSRWGDHCAINRWVETRFQPQRPAFIVHRLDRFASGLVLLAHTKKAARMLSALFQKKEIIKQYKVIVHGKFAEVEKSYNSEIDNKPAMTRARRLDYNENNNCSLLQVEIETGRKHQIRKHLAADGYPVVGDRLYGNAEPGVDLQLTAYKLSFNSPVDGEYKEYTLAEQYQPKC